MSGAVLKLPRIINRALTLCVALTCLCVLPASACRAGSVRGAARTYLTYHRDGGLAAHPIDLVVRSDRRVSVRPSSRAYRLTVAEMRALRRDVARAHLRRLAERPPRAPLPDAYQYTISAEGVTVRAVDGSIPRSLEPLLARLSDLVRRASR
jgi:hypothetical protein